MIPEQTFDQRVEACLPLMSTAERRVARFFQENRTDVLMDSAAVVAAKVSTSDATVVRTTRSLGFSGLDELRRLIAAELRGELSQADRLANTLQDVGDDLHRAFSATLNIHLKALEDLRRDVPAPLFKAAVARIAEARRILVFGIGPSSALADYFTIQLGRFGLDAASLTHTGLLFADDLQKLRKGDLVIMLAYGRVYAELAALLDRAKRLGLRKILMTDTLLTLLQGHKNLNFSGCSRPDGHVEHAYRDNGPDRGAAGRRRQQATARNDRKPEIAQCHAYQASGKIHGFA